MKLWRNRDFLRLWSAQTVSQFGSEITGLALPFAAILVLHASTFEVARSARRSGCVRRCGSERSAPG